MTTDQTGDLGDAGAWQAFADDQVVVPSAPQANAAIARWTSALLEAAAAGYLLVAVALAYRIDQLRGDFPQEHIRAADHAVTVVGRASLAVTAVTAVVFLVWMYRTSRVRQEFFPQAVATPTLAVLGWIIPLVSLFLPPFIVADLLRPLRRRTTPAVVLWWGLLLAATVVNLIGLGPTATIAQLRHHDLFRVLGALCFAASGVVVSRIVLLSQDLASTPRFLGGASSTGAIEPARPTVT